MITGRLSVSVVGAFAVSVGYVLFTSVSLVSGQSADQGGGAKSLSCPTDTMFGQPLALPGDPAFGAGFNAAGAVLFDNFSGVTEDILHVRWWGMDTTPISLLPCGTLPGVCSRDGNTFLIEFRSDNFGQPGALYYAETVSATKAGTGRYADELSSPPTYQFEICQYDVDLGTPCDLTAGWIGIRSPEESASTCIFVWLPSAQGDGLCYTIPGENPPVQWAYDWSFCLSLSGAGDEGEGEVAPVCPPAALLGQNPELTFGSTSSTPISDTAVGVRLYDNFAGLAAPIGALSWYGLEFDMTSPGSCSRTLDTFSIAFFLDNAGAYGEEQAHYDVTASKVSHWSFYFNPADPPWALYLYQATLPEPVALAEGWVSIQATGSDTCIFVGMPSHDGDSRCYIEGSGPNPVLNHDLGLCLLGVGGGEGEGQGEGVGEGEGEGEGVAEGEGEGGGEGEGEGEGEGVPEGEGEGVGEGEGPAEGEGVVEGTSEGEGTAEGEGVVEGEGEDEAGSHGADCNPRDWRINLTELLRVIQFFNIRGYQCAAAPDATEDGYLAGSGEGHACPPHSSDYNPQDWLIDLTELLRLIQFYNIGGYHACPVEEPPTEDGFCPGLV